jgi:hypothetical protein
MNRDTTAAFMQGLRGQLNGLDPNTYPVIPNDGDPDTVLNAGPAIPGTTPLNQQGMPSGKGRAYTNNNAFNQYFTTDLFFLNQNFNRNFLLIQNQNPTTGATALTMAVSFGVNGGVDNALQLAPGEGIVFDFICPNSSVYAQFIDFTGDAMAGYIIEGSYVAAPWDL